MKAGLEIELLRWKLSSKCSIDQQKGGELIIKYTINKKVLICINLWGHSAYINKSSTNAWKYAKS